ncbi:glyoxylate/hydroxypyruvate reductase A [Rhodobacter sp. CZR27]|uniref:2-hydroxyacid dehydrogenase n=1 Tax=Rhodobacter sp. CZR27 TaxID=2033869 RepID=UPI000BBE7D9E|nr:glyoxylate/hydroxypyruvate reductase A [Rhodobacter sp. CZR27]
MTLVLFAAGARRWPLYRDHLTAALAEAGVTARLVADAPDPEAVDYIVFAPGGDVSDFTPYRNAKAVLGLWAGVERIVGNASLTQPLCRMVDPAMTEGMVEWVTGHVLRHHLGLDRWIRGEPGWQQVAPPLARERTVAMLGLGELGAAAARALAGLNFRVLGWSRSEKRLADLETHHGEAGLERVLREAGIVVTLLPATPETENLLDARRLAWLPPGAVVLNPGRGTLIDDEALIAALDAGHLGHATLDVFRIEPLPDDHPFRHHPKVTVTPHIAAETRPASASRVIAENIRRGEAGEPFLHLVDRSRGY